MNSQRLKLSLTILAIYVTFLSIAVPQITYADPVKDAAQDLSYQILSPFCPGRALADCPSEQASVLKEKIKSELAAGKSKEVVYEEVIKEYGEQYRAVPDMNGLNSLAWITPLLIIAIGLAVVIIKIRSQTKEEEQLD